MQGSESLTSHDFARPRDSRWFEDYIPGSVFEYGYVRVDEDELVDFAERFDPQPIHTDRVLAARGPFGGIIASGWHTGGLMMRLYVDHYLSTVASLASPGIEELKWPVPVRPGDRLKLRAMILDSRLSRSKPDRGLVFTRAEMINQEAQVVLSMRAVNLLLREPAGG